MVSDQEFRKLAEKGWSDAISAIMRQGLPDSQMQILIELGLVGDNGSAVDGLPPAIDNELDELIQELLERANALMNRSRFPAAIQSFTDAINLLPDPAYEYEYALHAYAGIGDACFSMNHFPETVDALEQAKQCPGGIGNPFVHLRLGQAYFEQDNHDKAADELMRAYMGAGDDIFEDEEPKYLEFLRSRAQLD